MSEDEKRREQQREIQREIERREREQEKEKRERQPLGFPEREGGDIKKGGGSDSGNRP